MRRELWERSDVSEKKVAPVMRENGLVARRNEMIVGASLEETVQILDERCTDG